MAETREDRLEKLRASYNRWKNASAGSYNYADYDKEAAARIEALRAVYNQQFLPQQANKWARDASDFAKKISADAQARSKGYQSPDSLKAYQDSISPQLSDLIGRAKYAQQYAGLNNDAEYGKSVNDTLSYLNSIGKSLQNEQAYWAQWANEDAYKKSGNYYNDTYGEEAKGYKIESPAPAGRTMVSMGDLITPANSGMSTQAKEIYKLYSGRDYDRDMLSIGVSGGSGSYRVENYVPYLDQNERSLYLWLYDKEGKEKADEYLRSMHDTLAYRAGEASSRNIDNMSGGNQAARDTLNALFALPAGVNAWGEGILQAVTMPTGQVRAQSPWAVGQSLNREKGSDVGNVFSDLSYTFGNMAPSMAIGAAINAVTGGVGGAIAGDIALGLSSAGNSYGDARREGYDHGRAMIYGLVNGTLEAGMQHLLGGIKDLGGVAASKISKHATSYLNKLSNAGVRAVLQTGSKLLTSMGSEATEEYLQAVLDPLARNIILGEDNDFWAGFTSEDALYSALLGALSAGLLEGPGIITSAAEANKIGKRAFENGSWKGALDYAMQLDPESEPYKLAKALRDGTIKADGNNVGNLYTSLSEYMAESKKLVRKGKMTTDQYTSTAAAIDTIYQARLAAQQQSTPAATETAIGTDIPSVLNNDIYQEVKAVETDGKAAVREANIIARIADGDKSVTGSQIDSVVNTNAKTREIVASRLDVDLGNTNAEARRAVKQYMDTVSATKTETAANTNTQTAQTETANTAPKTEEETRAQAIRQEADAITKTMGTEGQAVYKQFTANMKLGDSLVYATEAMFRFYNQGVNAENSKHPSKKFRDIPGYEGISAEMKQAAYNAGRVDVQAKSGSIAEIVTKTKETAEKVAQQQAEIKKNVKASKVNIKELAPSAGKWSVDPKIDMDTLTTKQTAAVSYLKAVSEVSGINITLMSGVDVTGAFSVENGHYDGVTNTLYVSVNAGMQSITDITGSAILKTASHEITHYIAASGTQTYSLLEDYVLSRFTEQYGEKSVDNRIEDIQEQYKDQVGKELTREQAKEEMVAAACEMMLKNSEVFEKLARQNLTLAQRIKAGLDGFIKKLSANRKSAFENLDATSPEARAIAASETSLKETQKLWDNALKGAIKENEGRKSAGKDTMLELRDKRDTEYAKLAKDPEKNEKRLSQLVEQAAKAAGYDSPLLYHGTQSFGFTAFDLAKTDDGRSIFLTSNPDIASTYSGISGSRRISEAADIDVNGMSVREVAQMLNRFPPESGIDYAYSYVPGKAEIAEQVDSGIKELRKLTESLRERFANDSPEMYKLNHLRNVLDIGKTDSLSATLWTMLNKTDIFNGHTDFVNNLEQNIRLLKKAPESGGFVVEKSLDGYSIEVFTESAARKELSANLRRGNYALYAKLGNSLTVEGDGENWNALDFRAPDSKYEIQEDDGRYKIINKSTRSAEWANGKMSWNSKEEAQRIIDGFSDKNDWAKRLSNTRQIAEYAKEQGYDSVLFRNIRDNGGQNASTDFDTTADVYVIFNPNNVKSADTVTRDGNGNVIPLSQRFNAGENDIRFELRTTDSGTKYALVTEDISKVEVPGKPDASLGAKARYILNERFRNTVLQVGENDKVYVNKGGLNEYANPAKKLTDSAYAAKLSTSAELNELLKTATNVRTGVDDGRHPDAVRGWKYYDVLFAVKNSNIEEGYSVFEGKLNVKQIARGDLFHDITDIKEITSKTAGQNILSSISADSAGDSNSIFDIAENVNTEFELRSDENQFNPRKELSNLFMQIAQNEQETKSLRSYQAAIHELNNTEIEISKLQQEMQGTDKLKSPQKYYELQNKLRQAEAKLNRYDGRLVQLEATKPMKDLIARREQRLKEQFARSCTTRAKYRNNIKKNIRSLDKKLRTNSGQKHVLLELQPVVAQLLNVFTENTSVFKKEQLARLREIYAKFSPAADSKISSDEKEVTRWKSTAEYSSAYSEMIYDLIEEVRPLVQGKRLIDLDTELLAAVNDIVSNINKMVNQADEMFIAGRAESLREISENTMRDMENSGYGQKRNPRAETNKTAQNAKSFFSYKNAMPVYVFERLGDTAVEKLWDPLQAAAGKKAREEVADREYWQGLRRKYNHKSWDNNGRLVQLESGRRIYLTPQEAMSIYALDKREATHRTVGGKNIKHLQGGGISFPEAAKITVKDANGKTRTEYRLATSGGMRLTEGDIKTIVGLLTQEQRAYADDVVKYLSTTIADRGNAVSRELYGINIFNESYYFPITVDKTFLQQSITGQADKLIKNAGMTKSLTQDASKPVWVMDFDRIVAQHLLQMEGYDTLAIPLDNFQRWLNYESYGFDAKGKRTYNDKTVKQTMSNIYGVEMRSYIDNFLTDVNAASSRATNDGLLDKAIGVFKKNAVLASLSVAIQQPSAIGRALLYIDPKYFVGEGALKSWSKANLEEMIKYSDTAFIKENGAFDPAVSRGALEKMLYEEPETVKEKIKALISRDSTYRDNIAGWLPGVMDSITWRTLWMAIKNETADAHPELSRTSEEFLQIAGKRMDYVVNRTQVYDSMLSKSELMRSKSALMKMTTAFMNEPTTAYNMLYHAAEKLAVAKGTAKKAAAKHLARAVASFVTATALNALLKSLVTAARKDNPDDEDGKTYIEWYAGEVVGNFFDDLNPIKLLPVLRDVFSLIEGYDVERSDMESISKLIDAGKAIVDGNASLDKKLEKLLIAVGVATGIPLENLIRDTKGLRNVIMDIADGWQTTAEGVGNAAKSGLPFAQEDEGSINDKLFRAYMNQDETAIKRYEQAVTERFNKKKSAGGYTGYDSAEYYIRKEMRSRLAHSEEIKAVYDAAAAGDLQAYKAAVKALTDRGFKEIDVLDAKRTYANNLKKAAETPVQDTTATEPPEEETVIFDSSMFTAALENNDGTDRQIIEQQLEGLTPRSEEYKDKAAKLKSRITAYLKPKYQDAFLANDTATMLRISRQLQTYRQYGIVYNAEILTQWRKAARTDRK